MAKRHRHDVRVGQIWRYRDARSYSGSRRVRVVSEGGPGEFVSYRQVVGLESREVGGSFRSRYERFQSAFELLGVPESKEEQP